MRRAFVLSPAVSTKRKEPLLRFFSFVKYAVSELARKTQINKGLQKNKTRFARGEPPCGEPLF
jgi:hypothetical protein